jgi:hypothetical protein
VTNVEVGVALGEDMDMVDMDMLTRAVAEETALSTAEERSSTREGVDEGNSCDGLVSIVLAEGDG